MDTTYLEHCKNVLRTAGFVVIPEARRVFVNSRHFVPPQDLNYSIVKSERYTDMIRQRQLHELIHYADRSGLILHEKQDIRDPVTGHEVIFNSRMAMIAPKAEA